MKRVDSMTSTTSSSTSSFLLDEALLDSVPAAPPSSSPSASSPSLRRSEQLVYHPVISSIVRHNTLRNCTEVHDMMDTCRQHHAAMSQETTATAELSLCHTAQRYHDYCHSLAAGRQRRRNPVAN